MTIELLAAFLLSVIHYTGGKFSELLEKYHTDILSFSSGIAITIVMLEFLPWTSFAHHPYLLLLSGFVVFHIAERYVYQHVSKKELAEKDIEYFDALGFFMDSFLDGFLVVLAFKISMEAGYLILVSLILHKISSSIALAHITENLPNTSLIEFVLAFSTFIGAFVAVVLSLPMETVYSTFTFIVGTLLYIIVRDIMPKEKGNPLYFLFGVIVTVALVGI
jgi:zinc transporter ZupT